MKKNLICLIIAVLSIAACKKGTDTTQTVKHPIGLNNNMNAPLPGAGADETCEVCTTNTAPSQYTGYDAVGIANIVSTAPGFHIFADPAYDAGWAEGYADALFWINYYSTGICGYHGIYKVGHINGGPDTTAPLDYQFQQGEFPVGVFFTSDCGAGELSWGDLKCRLTHNCGPVGLKDQYYFNTTYPGVNTDQHSFDMGRYTAFVNYTNHQPLSPPPGP